MAAGEESVANPPPHAKARKGLKTIIGPSPTFGRSAGNRE